MPTNGAAPQSVLEATGANARLARVYAESLMAAAADGGQADAIGDELNAVAQDVLAGHPGIGAYLANRAVGRKNKLPVLTAAFGPNASDLFNKFLGVLNQNNRLDLLRWVAAAYQKLRDDAAGRVRVRVTSATPLTDAQLDTLKQTLATTLKAEPVLDAHTDPDLLGGLVVRVGDRVYDTSVRARLNNLRTHLLASGTHGNR